MSVCEMGRKQYIDKTDLELRNDLIYAETNDIVPLPLPSNGLQYSNDEAVTFLFSRVSTCEHKRKVILREMKRRGYIDEGKQFKYLTSCPLVPTPMNGLAYSREEATKIVIRCEPCAHTRERKAMVVEMQHRGYIKKRDVKYLNDISKEYFRIEPQFRQEQAKLGHKQHSKSEKQTEFTRKAELNLPRPKDGSSYSKIEAAEHVIKNTAPGSSSRSELIEKMSKKKYISSAGSLYEFLQKVERGDYVLDSPFGRRGRRKETGNSIPYQLRLFMPLNEFKREGAWRGKIILCHAKITPSELIRCELAPLIQDRLEDADICYYLGAETNYREMCIGTEVCRLYFDPKMFPPPPISESADQWPHTETLREYIKLKAYHCGSPVICKGSNKGTRERIFCCQKCYRASLANRCQPKLGFKGRISCPFLFTVRWDIVGFYIHLFDFGADRTTFTAGCGFHHCEHPNPVLCGDKFGLVQLVGRL